MLENIGDSMTQQMHYSKNCPIKKKKAAVKIAINAFMWPFGYLSSEDEVRDMENISFSIEEVSFE